MPQIVHAFQYVHHNGTRPLTGILWDIVTDSITFFQCVCTRYQYLSFRQNVCDSSRSVPVHTQAEDFSDNLCGFFINQPFFRIVGILAVAIGSNTTHVFAFQSFRFLHCFNLLTGISCIPFIKQIFERCKVIVFLYITVYIIIHSDKVNIFVGEDKFRIQSHFDIVTPEP